MKQKIASLSPLMLLILMILVISSACRHDSLTQEYSPIPPPVPDPGCAYYSPGYELPQSQSLQQLSEYISSEHGDYDLDGWFFYGSLIDENNPDDTCVFFIAVQRIEQKVNGFRAPMVPAVVGFNSKALGEYIWRGFFTIDINPLMTVTTNPWKVTLISPYQVEPPLITMSTVSGTMGAPGAMYRLEAVIPDTAAHFLVVDVLIRDRFGTVNQGDGPASFFAQYLTDEQRNLILNSSDRRVSSYLESSGDPMSCQGSFYYSLPLLDVEAYTVMMNLEVLSSGSKGVMWLDYVVQSYNQRAEEVFEEASWSFFAIQFPEIDAAMMVINIESATGSLPIARLFSNKGGTTLNTAHSPEYIWAINDINIQAIPNTQWESPKSHLKYTLQHRIQLTSADMLADLMVTMIRPNQEVYMGASAIKYEGLAFVEGTIGGQQVTGQAFVEIQPEGHLGQ